MYRRENIIEGKAWPKYYRVCFAYEFRKYVDMARYVSCTANVFAFQCCVLETEHTDIERE